MKVAVPSAAVVTTVPAPPADRWACEGSVELSPKPTATLTVLPPTAMGSPNWSRSWTVSRPANGVPAVDSAAGAVTTAKLLAT